MVKFIWVQMRIQNFTIKELCKRSGVSYSCFKKGRAGRASTTIDNIEALLNVLGYTMKPVVLERKNG
jgi:hypothetical protein